MRLRVMTYNVRGCRGMDGVISPARIAQVIRAYAPDLVALQELDVRRKRSGHLHQATEIAANLRMDSHFHAAHRVEEEEYGDAILSKLPIRLRKSGLLPAVPRYLIKEERGAIWVEAQAGSHRVQIVNTHLGLGRRERRLQAEALLGPDWCGEASASGPLILCGDFNSPSQGAVYNMLSARLQDACAPATGQRQNTYPTPFPLLCIDHIFASEQFKPLAADSPRTPLTRIASDHYPLICDLSLSAPR